MTDTMVSTREVPWMKLGKLAQNPMTAAEAAELGGLNFQVEKRPLAFAQYNGDIVTWKSFADRVAVVRTDTEQMVGVMAKTYPIVQYREAFDFMDTVHPQYVAAGALKGGKQGFIVVRVPDHFKVLPHFDPHEMYMVLRTSHDGSRAVEVMMMPLRNRCMNQLTLQSFSAGVPHRWAITHSGNVHAKLAEAQKSLTNADKYVSRFEENVDKLTALSIKTDEKATALLKNVLPDRPRRDDQIATILSNWHTSDTVGKQFDHTGWGLLNALSDHLDWGRNGGTAESRMIGAVQGSTHKLLNTMTARMLSGRV
jgi:phage/plasmid-like protein (TIGR03299 family)